MGISSGAAYTIPGLFLAVFNRPAIFSRLIDPKVEGIEQIDGDDCYKIGGATSVSKEETFWISKSDHLLRQYSRSLEPPPGGAKLPAMTDTQVDAAIKGMGQEVNDANRKQMRAMMQRAQDQVKAMKLKGESTEVQLKINSPQLTDADFAYQVPPGTQLKDSLFNTVLKPK